MTEVLNMFKTHQVEDVDVKVWFKAASVDHFPTDGGACVKYKDLQVAVFNFDSGKKWYACQNLCPHKMEMILSRGLTGSVGDIPKVSCPYHKRAFSLESGDCLTTEAEGIAIYPVKIQDGQVFIGFSK